MKLKNWLPLILLSMAVVACEGRPDSQDCPERDLLQCGAPVEEEDASLTGKADQPSKKKDETQASGQPLRTPPEQGNGANDPPSVAISPVALETCRLDEETGHSRKPSPVEFALPEKTYRPLREIKAISVRKLTDEAGYGHHFGASYALREDGQVLAWGGRYGDHVHGSASFPRRVEGLPPIDRISGEFALDREGFVWFLNGSNPPFRIEDLPRTVSISSLNGDAVAAAADDGSLWLWAPEIPEANREEKRIKVREAAQVRSVYGDLYTLYWIEQDGDVRQAHVNWDLSLQDVRKLPLPDGETAEKVDTTFGTDFIRTSGGRYYRIESGPRLEPVPLEQVVRVTGSHDVQFFLKADGSVWGQGTDTGLLGEPDSLPDEPVQIQGMPEIADIRSGSDHVLALAKDGSVYSWGSNMYGQLGRYPHFFETFTPLAQLEGIRDVWTVGHEIRLIVNGDVWRINERMEAEPVLVNRHAAKLAGPDRILLEDGTFLLRDDDTCLELKGKENIRDIARDADGWIALFESGDLYQIRLRDQVVSVKKVVFPSGTTPEVRKMRSHPFFTVLTGDGAVYFKKEETDKEVRMDRIGNLPPLLEWSTLDGAYYDGYGNVFRALDRQGDVYRVKLNIRRGEDQQIVSMNAELLPAAKNVRRLDGGLIVTADGAVVDTGANPYAEKPTDVGKLPNLLKERTEIRQIYPRYLYPIEGPRKIQHVLVSRDGAVMLYGHSPFYPYVAEPGPVVVPGP